MSIRTVFLSFLILFSHIALDAEFSVISSYRHHQATTSNLISLSICEVIENFYTKYSRNVDIIDFGRSQGEIVSKIMENLNNSMTVTLHNPQNVGNWNKKLESQAILLFDNFRDLKDFNNNDWFKLRYINSVRILVYCKNANEIEISNLNTVLAISPYYFFMILDRSDMKIKLFTFENRNDLKVCNESQRLLQVNEFAAANLTWINEPIFPKKFKNFHGCTMNIGATYDTHFVDTKIEQDGKTGFLYNILEDSSKYLNFSLGYVLCVRSKCFGGHRDLYTVAHVAPLQDHSIDGDYLENTSFDLSFSILNLECTLKYLVPPSEQYTLFEKMVLSFSTGAWITVAVTFLTSIATIFAIGRFPEKIKHIFSGTTIRSPTVIIFRAFLGMRQTQLPKRGFARFILTSFVLWCFVMRTAYLGKLFEFTTSAIHKPEIKSVEELLEKGFPLYAPKNEIDNRTLIIVEVDKSFMSNNVGLKRQEFNKIFIENFSDPTFIGTAVVNDLEYELTIHFSEIPLPKRFVLNPVTKTYYAIGFSFPTCWNERLREIIEGLVTGGIVNYYLDVMRKSKWNLMNEQIRREKVVVNLSHLSFVFQIGFFAVYGSFLVFLLELAIGWVTKKWSKNKSKIAWKSVMQAATAPIIKESFSKSSKYPMNSIKLEEEDMESEIIYHETLQSLNKTSNLSIGLNVVFGEEVQEATDSIEDLIKSIQMTSRIGDWNTCSRRKDFESIVSEIFD